MTQKRLIKKFQLLIETNGGEDFHYKFTGKGHIMLLWTINGKKCMHLLSKTASDHRSILNSQSQIKREFRRAN